MAASTQDFYVHDMVAHMRDEPVPNFIRDQEGILQPIYDEMTVESTSAKNSKADAKSNAGAIRNEDQKQ